MKTVAQAIAFLLFFCVLPIIAANEKKQPESLKITAISGAIVDKDGNPGANGMPIFFAGTKQILSGGVFKFNFTNFDKEKKIFILIGKGLEWQFIAETKTVEKISSISDKNILLFSIEHKVKDDKGVFVFSKEEIKGYDNLPKKRCLILPISPEFVDQNLLTNVELPATSGVITLPTIHLLPEIKTEDGSKVLRKEIDHTLLDKVSKKDWSLHGSQETASKIFTQKKGSVQANQIIVLA